MGNALIVGAGSWGTALSLVLADNGYNVKLWDVDRENLDSIRVHHENFKYLPGVFLPQSVSVAEDVNECYRSSDLVVFAVPAQHFGQVFRDADAVLNKDALIVNVAKGIDQNSLKRMSEIALEILPDANYAVLSGPSHAEEVGRRIPTMVTVASYKREVALQAQDAFMNPRLRVYTNDDVVGVELGGSLKNIIAVMTGISDGLGYGDNTRAAMMTRGLTEITRLGIKLGADPNTFSGLSGMGDLIVTSGSMHSRNRRCGILIGQGLEPEQAVKEVGMVVEGVYTARAALKLAREYNVNMPITEALVEIMDGKISARDAFSGIMLREKKHENEDILKKINA